MKLVKLGEVCRFFNGKAHEKNIDSNGKFAVVNSKCISSNFKIQKFTNEQLFPLFKNDIVMVMSDVPNGKALAKCRLIEEDKKYSLNQRIACIRSDNFYIPYLLYQLDRNPYFLKFDNGENQTNLRKDDILNCPLYLPSIEEQQRIVAKLDAAFAAIDKIYFNTLDNKKKLENIITVYFDNIEKKIDNLIEKDIGELCNLMTGGTPKKNNKSYYHNGKIPWLVSGDVNKGIINDCEGRITELGYENSNAKYLPTNSVIIALNGQGKTRGSVAILKIKATCNQSLVSIYPKEKKIINIEYIYYYLKSKYYQIRKITGDSGNDRRGLNMPLIRKIKIKFPKDYQEQIKIVTKINILTNYILQLEENYQNKINNLSKLKNAILIENLSQKDLEVA